MVKLTGRLSAAAALCRRGVIVCDVGTDHALLACYLAQNGAKEVIASDVKEGPLSAARRTIAEQGVTNVTAVLSDGLDRIDYADDVVICGMGGELIMKIISGCRFLSEDTRFILQPMTAWSFTAAASISSRNAPSGRATGFTPSCWRDTPARRRSRTSSFVCAAG